MQQIIIINYFLKTFYNTIYKNETKQQGNNQKYTKTKNIRIENKHRVIW